MYPGTIVNWHDESYIPESTVDVTTPATLFLVGSSFDRGPEDLRVVNGQTFFDLYGTPSFDKHGQPAIQAANVIRGGGTLLVKRVVAKDATLANIVVIANIKTTINAEKTDDENGKTLNQLEGHEDTDDDKTAQKYTPHRNVTVTWSTRSIANVSNIDGVRTAIEDIASSEPVEDKGAGIIYIDEDGNAIPVTLEEQTITTYTDEDNKVIEVASQETVTTYTYTNADGKTIDVTKEKQRTVGSSVVTTVYKDIDGVIVTKKDDDDKTVPITDEDVTTINTTIYRDEDGEAITKKDGSNVTADDLLTTTSNVYKDADGNIVTKEDGTNVTDNDVTDTEVLSGSQTIPMLIVTDNGRGLSNKSIRIIPDYNTSRNSKNFFYNARVYEGTDALENVTISFNPAALANDISYGINQYSMSQVILDQPEKSYSTFINAVAEGLGLDPESDADQDAIDQLVFYDLIGGKTNKKVNITDYTIASDSVDLNSDYGIALEQGTNGSFGSYPNPGNPVDTTLTTDATDNRRVKKAYSDALTWFFYPSVEKGSTVAADMEYDYEGSDKIFDLDDYKIAACFDANYPDTVKTAIGKLANFREDFFYFRDMGIQASTYQDIKDIAAGTSKQYTTGFNENSRYIGNYCTWYQILDPSSRVRIKVTMMYDFARAMIDHFVNGAYRPIAGFVNNMILDNAIQGTINFTPRITPITNQKSLLDDLRINYAIFQNNRCVVQSLYTSQEAYTQLSYINNVLGIQEVIRAVRNACPAFRYTFAQKSDFSSYATAVSNVLMNYSSNFAELSFDYTQDALKASQKIFYATISFRFNNWAQTEVFDIYALPDADL